MPARGVKYSDSEVATPVQKRRNRFSSKKLGLITGCVRLSNSEKKFRIGHTRSMKYDVTNAENDAQVD